MVKKLKISLKLPVTTIQQLLPDFGIKNIRIYYLVTIFSGAWFIIANWLFFALKFVTPMQIGIIESISFGAGLLLEIPSGAIADLLGKKITVQMGLFLQTLGTLLFMFAAYSPWFIAIGNLIIIASFALISGAIEALAYDSMVEAKQESHYDTVAARIGTIYPLLFVLTAFIGGMLWKLDHYYPWIATAVCFAVAFVLSFKFSEPKVDTYQFSWKQFLQQTKTGIQQLQMPQLQKYLPILLVLLATHYMWGTGIIRIFMGEQFGYDGETLSYLVSAVMLISAVAVFHLSKLKRILGNLNGIIFLTIISLVGWLLSGVFHNSLVVGFFVFLCLTVTGQLADPWRATVINKYIDSKYRATTISTLQLFIQIPYVVIAILFGTLIETQTVKLFYLLVGFIMLCAVIWSVRYTVAEKMRPKLKQKSGEASGAPVEVPAKISREL